MQQLKKLFLFTIGEILVVFMLLFTFNNYLGNDKETIKSDGIGYYDYLPSIFIHSDINRHKLKIDDTLNYRINTLPNYLEYQNKKVNKYPIGTALLETPFFLIATITACEFDTTGYEEHYHQYIFIAALFYLFLGLLFFKLLLKKFQVKWQIIIITQILITFATSITIYTNFDAAFSHIYSFFAIIAFSYFVKMHFTSNGLKYFLWACLFLGVIIIIRQINVLVILSVPFFAGSLAELKSGFKRVFSNPKKLILGIVLCSSMLFIQVLVWYLQTGHFLIYSYQGEGFNFASPEIYKVLFSYEKGLFVYSPVLFICALSSVAFLIKRQFYLFISWVLFLIILIYIFSSWWSWHYGVSYGMRPIIDFYIFLFIPFALLLNQAKWFITIPVIILSFMLIPINLIQSYQYKRYIIDWNMLNKENYWKIFLHTEDQFQGYVWERNKSTEDLIPVFTHSISKIILSEKVKVISIPLEISKSDSIKSIQKIEVTCNNRFKTNLSSHFVMEIDDEKGNVFKTTTYLFHFSKDPNIYQEGSYIFDIDTIALNNPLTLSISITKSDEIEILKDLKVTVFGK